MLAGALECRDEFDEVMAKVETTIPNRGQAFHRIVTSYSWLMFATQKVNTIIVCSYNIIMNYHNRCWMYLRQIIYLH